MDMSSRNKMSEQDPVQRAKNFEEVALGFDLETAIAEAKRCLNCKLPKCRAGCPVAIDIPAFIQCVKDGDLDKADKIIKETNNLPAVCGRVCPQEEQCEKLCIRQEKLGGPVAIGALERFVADYALKKEKKAQEINKNGLKAAIIGSGPAGLTCAADLAAAGYEVTVYEAFHKAGGVLVYGIPEFRLPKAMVAKEIEGLEKLGVKILLNTIIGKTIMLEELIEENDAVFIGTGAGLPTFQGIKGENLNGVYSANEYLTRVNLMGAYKKESFTPIAIGKKVVVVGAGNVAMDSARTALRMGAEEVHVVYRRSKAEMPARHEEIVHAEQEGIIFDLLTNPVEILGDKRVEGVRCVKMTHGEPDSSGRRRPVELSGSEFEMSCDQVIMAIGTSPNPLIKNSCKALEVTKRGTIIVNEQNQTSIPEVYAGGDAVTGAATVILAMGAGKNAASAIIEKHKSNN
ncbi:MAG: NADPH-dependent glutamate synthase [Clostridia bacterium]|nr:NADPH-dependent glutamate synthase [Clostridia bacterium]